MSAKSVYKVDLTDNKHKWSGVESIDIRDGVATVQIKGKQNTYVLRCRLPADVKAAGVGAQVFLGNWKSIDYVAIGYTQKLGYRHIKAKNIRQNAWVDLAFTHQDMIWQLQNGFDGLSDANIGDIKLFIKGEPGDAVVKLCQLQILASAELTTPPQDSLSKPLVDVLTMHFRRALRDYNYSASQYMQTGQCPMPGKQLLPWSLDAVKPQKLASVNSFCSSWHGMHLVIALMLHAEDTQSVAPIMAARAWVEQWLDNSYFKPDSDHKYTWYDHGTAERLMALLLLWHKTAEQGRDQRFANRLWHAILTHTELLNSEAFYAYHQPVRYHNHAWFQDAALIAVALAFPQHESASAWLKNAISRFEDQLEKLIVRDGGYAIFVENSIGYHHGVQKLAEVVGALVSISGRETDIPSVAKELTAWSDFLRYPDGRVPAQGDTFRLSPLTGMDIRRGKPWEQPSCTVLPKAGYAVVKGNHDNKPWMLCLFNTSLSATHKHEDNLSITFWFDGIEWLIDPSFYSHEYNQEIPKYLRSVEAHNAPYIRSSKSLEYNVGDVVLSLENVSDKYVLLAEYSPVNDLILNRKVEFYLDRIDFNILDSVVRVGGDEMPPLFSSLHFSEVIAAIKEDKTFFLSSDDSETVLQLCANNIDSVQLYDSYAAKGFLQKSTIEKLIFISGAGQIEWSIHIKDAASDSDLSNSAMSQESIDKLWSEYGKTKVKSLLGKIKTLCNKTPKIMLESNIFGPILQVVRHELQLFYKGNIDDLNALDIKLSAHGNTVKSQLAQMLFELDKPLDKTVATMSRDLKCDVLLSEFIEKILNSTSIEKVEFLQNGFSDFKVKVDVCKTLVVEIPFICLKYEGERLLVLSLQTPMDAVYLPSRGVLINSDTLRFNASDRLVKLFSWMLKNPLIYSRLWVANASSNLMFLVRDKRPYHVLLDELSGHFELLESGCDLPKLFFSRSSFIENSQIVEFSDADSYVFDEVIVCNHKRADKDDFSERYYSYLKNQANQIYILKDKPGSIVFWISISGGEKRRWFEEKEALIAFVSWAKNRFENCHFYVDGWTSPQKLSETDQQQIESHNRIWCDICDVMSLNDSDYTSFIGASILKKLWGAEQAAFFVSCAGTPSVWPSLICKVPGIVHNSKSMIKMVGNTYSHINVYRIPDAHIEDVNEVGDKIRWDKYSYSISADIFLESLESALKLIFPYKKPIDFYNALVLARKNKNFGLVTLLEWYCKQKLANYRNLKHVLESSAFFGRSDVEILYEVEEAYRVIDCNKSIKSDIVYITFGKVSSHIDHIPFAYPFLNNLGFKHFHVAQARGTSYQKLSLHDFSEMLGPLLKSYCYRFTYGPSLGGYAALYYATQINAHAIAGSPRLPLHPENKQFEGTYWTSGSHWDEADYVHVPFSDIDTSETPEPFIIYDSDDQVDANYIKNCIVPYFDSIHFLDVPDAKHGALMKLSKMGQLKRIITGFTESIREKYDA